MTVKIGCLAGEETYRQWEAGHIAGEKLGRRQTPFGPSGDVFLVTNHARPFYLLSRYGPGLAKTAPARISARANLYALQELGVHCVLDWAPGGAVRHNIAVGDLVVLDDLIDRTFCRERTFFEDCPLGYLRQFPVFCTTLRGVAEEVMLGMKLAYHRDGTAAVSEGPRLETPAEIRLLADAGAAVVTHLIVPEAFLAKELQLCYAAVCYVVNYAETGSRHRPFVGGGLFGDERTPKTHVERVTAALLSIPKIMAAVAETIEGGGQPCECDRTMANNIERYHLSADWHDWFGPSAKTPAS